MSIILKGLDIEKYSQAIIIHPSGKVYKYDGDWRIDNNSPYQAIQIPKGHGNIIDGSKAVVTETIDGYYEITAPTILEAEE